MKMNRTKLNGDNDDINLDILQRKAFDNGQTEGIDPKKKYYTNPRPLSEFSTLKNLNRSSSNIMFSPKYKEFHSFKSSKPVFKPSGKNATCTVVMLDREDKTFEIDSASLGKQLFDRVTEELQLCEPEYFGLKYNDKSLNIWFWLRLDKKISEQLKKNIWAFVFQVKFFTPHINSIREHLTRYLFCLQVRQQIIEETISASFNVLALLGAYTVQSEAGGLDETVHKSIDYIKKIPFAPETHQTDEFLMYIAELHQKIRQNFKISLFTRKQSPELAKRNFLWNATKLGMYGVDLHKVKNSQNEDVCVGVYHSGILIYKGKVRVIKYSWPQIIKLSYLNKSFLMLLRATNIDKRNRMLEFKCTQDRLAKRLWLACVDHHEFFRMIDAENPGKPCLVSGFGTRKYLFGSTINNSFDSDNVAVTPKNLLNLLQPKIRRVQTERKDNRTLVSLSGMAPVANNDELLLLDDDLNDLRPKLPSEHWRMSVDDCSPQMLMNPSGLDLAAKEDTGWQNSRANKGIKGSGKYYYEGKIVEEGLVRLGWSTKDASLDLGLDKNSFGYGNNQVGTSSSRGLKRNNNEEKPYGKPIHVGDTIGCSIDLDNGKIQWSKDGIQFEFAYTIPDEIKMESFFPACSIKDARVLFNFGNLPMENKQSDDWKTVSEAPFSVIVPNEQAGWRMNPFDATKGTKVAENGLVIQSKYKDEWNGCRANKGLYDSGKYYYEVVPLEDGLAKVGWATDDGNLNLGNDANGFGYGSVENEFGFNGNQGKKINGGEINNFGDAFNKYDVIGCFLDLDDHKIKWSKNGKIFNEAFKISDDLIEYRAFYPTASLLNSTLEFNFGYKPFEFYPGNEWNPVCCAAQANTEHSKKQNPLFFNRSNVDVQEDILELRRERRDKLRNTEEDEKKEKEKEEEKKQKLINENERIELQEKRRRILLQEERENKERKKVEDERHGKKQEIKEADQKILFKDKNIPIQNFEITNFEEESQTVIKGKPEISTKTYIDEEGHTVTKIIKKTKITTRTSINRNSMQIPDEESDYNTDSRMKGFEFINDKYDGTMMEKLEDKMDMSG